MADSQTKTYEKINNNINNFFETINENFNDIPDLEDNKNINSIYADTLKDDHSAINELMLDILSPQLSQNETQKRKFKQDLLKYIQIILSIQLSTIGVFLLIFTIALCFSQNSTLLFCNISKIIEFFMYYISAIIVELIAMLFFIVKFVFDKSIVDLLSDTIKKK